MKLLSLRVVGSYDFGREDYRPNAVHVQEEGTDVYRLFLESLAN